MFHSYSYKYSKGISYYLDVKSDSYSSLYCFKRAYLGSRLAVPRRAPLQRGYHPLPAALSLAARRPRRAPARGRSRSSCWSWPRSPPSTCRWSTRVRWTRWPQGQRPAAGHPGRADRRLRPAARRLRRLRRDARRGVRRGAAAHGAAAWRCGPSGTCTGCRCASTSTGRPAALSRAIERGTAGIESVLRLAVFNIVPTLLEVLHGHGDPVAAVRLAVRRA